MRAELLKRLSEGNTPAYVLDLACLRDTVLRIKERLQVRPHTELCYAMKANPFLVEPLNGLVDRFEVCSPGELAICRRANIPMDKVLLSGVHKGYEDTLQALSWGVTVLTAESWDQLRLIQKCAAETGCSVKVLPRLSNGKQFGVDREAIRAMIEQRAAFPNICFHGIHYFTGTQKKAGSIRTEMEEASAFCLELERDYGIPIERLEYGPGLAVDYFGRQGGAEDGLDSCTAALGDVDPRIQVTIELGRFIAADCGSYVTKVVDAKRNMGQQFCIVDGGIHHVNYYGQVMGVRVPPVRCYQDRGSGYREVEVAEKAGGQEGMTVCGSLCTFADVLIQALRVPDVRTGDLLVFEKIGAYSITEGIYLFLSRRLPKVYLLENGELALLRDAYETYEWNSRNSQV